MIIFESLFNKGCMRTKEGNKEKDILNAAVKIFAEYGYHNSKIYQIAQEASVATGSVYVYYKNKEDLLHKIFEMLWSRLYLEMKKVVETKSASSIEKIDSMIDLYMDVFAENPSLALVFVNEQINASRNPNRFTKYYDKFLDLAESTLEKGKAEGEIIADLDMIIFRQFIFGALRNLIHRWAEEPEEYSLGRIRRNFKFFIKHGIVNK